MYTHWVRSVHNKSQSLTTMDAWFPQWCRFCRRTWQPKNSLLWITDPALDGWVLPVENHFSYIPIKFCACQITIPHDYGCLLDSQKDAGSSWKVSFLRINDPAIGWSVPTVKNQISWIPIDFYHNPAGNGCLIGTLRSDLAMQNFLFSESLILQLVEAFPLL